MKQNGEAVDSITGGANPVFEIGGEASISVGYDSKKNEVFSGYISGIKQKFPISFKLEDPIYQLKRNSITKSYSSVSLDQLLKEIIPTGVEYKTTAEVTNLGQFRINGVSTARILDELRREHGIFSFFRGGVFVVCISSSVACHLRVVVHVTFHVVVRVMLCIALSRECFLCTFLFFQCCSSPTFAKISAPALRIFVVGFRAPETKL